MNRTLLTILAVTINVNALAAIPAPVKNLMNKSGKFISTFDGKEYAEEHGADCEVMLNPYGDENSIKIEAGAYFTPVAHFENNHKEKRKGDTIIYEMSDSGKRPGGSICGNTPLASYQKTVEVTGNTVSIKQKYRCFLEFKSTEIVQGCRITK